MFTPLSPPALALVELASIARGVVVSDAMVKKAPVRILQTHPISPGKHVIVVAGEVAEVEESMATAVEVAGSALVDRLFLPQAHPPLIAGAPNPARPEELDSVGILETHTVCATVVAADAAAKAADVVLLDMRLGQGIGGKAFFTLTGDLNDVQAALEAGEKAIEPALLVGTELIPAPHDDLRRRLLW